MKPRFIAFVSAVVGIAAALAAPAPAQARDISTAGALLDTKSGDVRLTADIKIDTAWHIDGNMTLDLNGHSIDRGLSDDESRRKGSVLYLEEGSRLTLKDSGSTEDVLDGTGKVVGHAYTGAITGGWGWYDAGGIECEKNCSIYMYGGNITGNHTSENGGGIALAKGCKFYMYDGQITQNVAAKVADWRSCGYGGGIYAVDAEVHIEGGSIENNKTDSDHRGGGIYAKDSSIEISGGLIQGNRAQSGAGVFYHADKSKTFKMSGGSIEKNVAEQDGGGIDIDGAAKITGGRIAGNRAKIGAGAYVEYTSLKNSPTVELGKVTICDNTASGQGGGLYSGAVNVVMDGSTVSNNTASQGGGIYASGLSAFFPARFTLEDGTITQNSATSGASALWVSNSFDTVTVRGGHIVDNNPKRSGATSATCPAVSGSSADANTGSIDIDARRDLEICENRGGNLGAIQSGVWVKRLLPSTRIGVTGAISFLSKTLTFGTVSKDFASEADRLLGCFFPDDSSMVVSKSGDSYCLEMASTAPLDGGTVRVTAATVESYPSQDQEQAVFKKSFVTGGKEDASRSWSFIPDTYIDRGDVRVTVDYTLETATEKGGKVVQKTEKKTSVFEHQNLSTMRAFTVTAKSLDGKTTRTSSCRIKIDDFDTPYATTKVESIATDGTVKTQSSKRGLGSYLSVETAATYGDAVFTDWTVSTDGGKTWKTVSDTETVGEADGMVTVRLALPQPGAAVPESICLRPLYVLKGVTLHITAPQTGEKLSTEAPWVSNATGATKGTATVAWFRIDGGATVAGDSTATFGATYRASVNIDAGDYVIVGNKSKCMVMTQGGRTVRFKNTALHEARIDFDFKTPNAMATDVEWPQPELSFEHGTTVEAMVSALPALVNVNLVGGGTASVPVAWKLEGAYDPSCKDAQTVTFSGSIDLASAHIDAPAGIQTTSSLTAEVKSGWKFTAPVLSKEPGEHVVGPDEDDRTLTISNPNDVSVTLHLVRDGQETTKVLGARGSKDDAASVVFEFPKRMTDRFVYDVRAWFSPVAGPASDVSPTVGGTYVVSRKRTSVKITTRARFYDGGQKGRVARSVTVYGGIDNVISAKQLYGAENPSRLPDDFAAYTFNGWTPADPGAATWSLLDHSGFDEETFALNFAEDAVLPSNLYIDANYLAPIDRIRIQGLDAPVAGEKLTQSVTWFGYNGDSYKIGTQWAAVSWTGDRERAGYGESLTATMTIESKSRAASARFQQGVSAELMSETEGAHVECSRISDTQVKVYVTYPATAKAALKDIEAPEQVTVVQGTPFAEAGLPDTVKIEAEDGTHDAAVTWDASTYAADEPGDREVTGLVQLPDSVDAAGHDLAVRVKLHVKEAPKRSYKLTVEGGTGSGSYHAGETVHVAAGSVEGKVFEAWKSEGVELTDDQRSSVSLDIVMPASDATLTATYKDVKPTAERVALTIGQPVGGKALATGGTATVLGKGLARDVEVGVSWKTDGQVVSGTAGFSRAYTVTAVLRPGDAGASAFAADAKATVNGETASIERNQGDGSVTVTYAFEPTAAPKLTAAPQSPAPCTVYVGTTFEALGLPERITVQTEDGPRVVDVSWKKDGYEPDAPGTYEVTGAIALDAAGIDAGDYSSELACHVTVQSRKIAAAPRVTGENLPGAYSGEAGTTLSVELATETAGATVRYQVVETGAAAKADGWLDYKGAVGLAYGDAGSSVSYDVLAYTASPDAATTDDSSVARFAYTLSVPKPRVTIDVRGTNELNSEYLYSVEAAQGERVTLVAEPLVFSTFDHWECDVPGVISDDKRVATSIDVDTSLIGSDGIEVRAIYRAVLDDISLTLDAPAAGEPLATTVAASLGAGGTDDPISREASVSWSPADSDAQAGTAYTATVRIVGAGVYALEETPDFSLRDRAGVALTPASWGVAVDGADLLVTIAFDKLPEPEPTYALTVEGGTGSGSYRAGKLVHVEAGVVAGKTFEAWESEGIDLTDVQRSSATLDFDMPARDATLTATYRDEKPVVKQVALTVAAPAGGQDLVASAGAEADGAAAPDVPVSWELDGQAVSGRASYGTAYALVAVLDPDAWGVTFDKDIAVSVNGVAAKTEYNKADGTVAVTFGFPATSAPKLTADPVDPDAQIVYVGTDVASLGLPDRIAVQTEEGPRTVEVSWDVSAYRKDEPGAYRLKGALDLAAAGIDAGAYRSSVTCLVAIQERGVAAAPRVVGDNQPGSYTGKAGAKLGVALSSETAGVVRYQIVASGASARDDAWLDVTDGVELAYGDSGSSCAYDVLAYTEPADRSTTDPSSVVRFAYVLSVPRPSLRIKVRSTNNLDQDTWSYAVCSAGDRIAVTAMPIEWSTFDHWESNAPAALISDIKQPTVTVDTSKVDVAGLGEDGLSLTAVYKPVIERVSLAFDTPEVGSALAKDVGFDMDVAATTAPVDMTPSISWSSDGVAASGTAQAGRAYTATVRIPGAGEFVYGEASELELYDTAGKALVCAGSKVATDGDDLLVTIAFDKLPEPEPTYALTVDGGTGSGSYRAGERVHVGAGAVAGKTFEAWESEGVELTDGQRTSPSIDIAMPARDARLKATYKDVKPTVERVALTVAAPAGGQDLAASAGAEADGAAAPDVPVSWELDGRTVSGRASYGAAYALVAVLDPDAWGVAFDEGVAVTVNGEAAKAVYNRADGTVAVTFGFPATSSPKLTADPVDPDARAVYVGTGAAGLALPERMTVQTEDGPKVCSVAWDTSGYRGNEPGTYRLEGALDLAAAGVDAGPYRSSVTCLVTVQERGVAAAPRVAGDNQPGSYTGKAGAKLSVELSTETAGAAVRYQVVEPGAAPRADGWLDYEGAVALVYGDSGSACAYDVLAYAASPDPATTDDSPVARFCYVLSVPDPKPDPDPDPKPEEDPAVPSSGGATKKAANNASATGLADTGDRTFALVGGLAAAGIIIVIIALVIRRRSK